MNVWTAQTCRLRSIQGGLLRASGLHLLLLLALGWTTSADASAQAPAAASGPDPDLFDRLIAQVDRNELIVTSPQEVAELVRRLDLLRPSDDPRRELRLRAFRCYYDELGPPASGLVYARAGLTDAQRLHDVGMQIRFALCEAGSLNGSGQSGLAIGTIEKAVALARRHNDPGLLALALSHRGNLRSLAGRQAAALTDFLEAQRVYNDAGLQRNSETNLQNIAIAYRRMGDLDKAMEYLRQGVAFAERERDWILLTVTLVQTAFVHEDSGRYEEALAVQRRAAKVASGHGLEFYAAACHLGMASVQVKKGDLDGAEDSLAVARAAFDRLGDRSNEGMMQFQAGQIRAGRSDHVGALAHFRDSAKAFENDPNLRYLVDLYAARARSHEALGNFRAALTDIKLERDGRKRLYDEARIQQSLLLQYQFDTARRDLENASLQAERRSQQERLDDIERANRWQVAALLSGGLLMALLLFLLLQQLRRMQRINALALTDALTGVANRRRIEAAAQEAVFDARASGKPLAVLTFDLDWFKRINDNHGHASGDKVLMRMARTCEAALRQNDLLGRIGGEEFVVLLPETPLDAAMQVAERLRESVEQVDLTDIAADLRVTISVGLSLLLPRDEGLHDVIDRADTALYRAKAAGRNRVEMEI